MKSSGNWVLLLAVICSLVQLSLESTTLQVKMISFRNSNGRDYDNKPCDGFLAVHLSSCDHRFKFCLDIVNGNQDNFDACAFFAGQTGEFRDRNDNTFDHDMNGVANPIVRQFDQWPGGLLFKVEIKDDDTGHSGHDLVDRIARQFYVDPARNRTEADTMGPTRIVYTGIRNHEPTSLTVEWKVWCDKDYYGSTCAMYCVAQNSSAGHYTCHPDTGAKVCLPGWESPAEDCLIWSNDCSPDPCHNSAVCKDGNRTYSCICKPGYTGSVIVAQNSTYVEGKDCEQDIDECASGPCLNNGTCQDLLADYNCTCLYPYQGRNCETHICQVTPPKCLNGGTCYADGLCLCAEGYTGTTCEKLICNGVACENNGTCLDGQCHCLPGFVGQRCDVNICDYHACHNGGTCLPQNTCQCAPGWTGVHCEYDINECENTTCYNGGTCKDKVNGFLCYCLPEYTGKQCEVNISTITKGNPLLGTALGGLDSTIDVTTEKDPGHINRVDKLVSSDEKKKTGLIVGIIIGGFAILLFAIIVLALMRRRRRKKNEAGTQSETFTNPMYHDGQVTLGLSSDNGTQQSVNVTDQGTQVEGAVGGEKSDMMFAKQMPPEYGPYPYDAPPCYYAELPQLPQYEAAAENPYEDPKGNIYDTPRAQTTYDTPRQLPAYTQEGATAFDEPIYEAPPAPKSIPQGDVSRPEEQRASQVPRKS